MTDGRKGIHVFNKVSLVFGQRWYFNGKSGNGQITMQSEAYNSRPAAYQGIRATAAVFGADADLVPIYEKGQLMNAYGQPRNMASRKPKK